MVSSSSTSTCTYITDGPGPNERYRCTSYVPRDHGDEDTHTHTLRLFVYSLCIFLCQRLGSHVWQRCTCIAYENASHRLLLYSLPPSLSSHLHTHTHDLLFSFSIHVCERVLQSPFLCFSTYFTLDFSSRCIFLFARSYFRGGNDGRTVCCNIISSHGGSGGGSSSSTQHMLCFCSVFSFGGLVGRLVESLRNRNDERRYRQLMYAPFHLRSLAHASATTQHTLTVERNISNNCKLN